MSENNPSNGHGIESIVPLQYTQSDLFEEAFKISLRFFSDNIISYLKDKNVVFNQEGKYYLTANWKGNFLILGDEIKQLCDNFSLIFKDITTVPKFFNNITTVPKLNKNKYAGLKKESKLTHLNNKHNIGGVINYIIKTSIDNNIDNNKIIKLLGPVGSYKNRLLQYIYLYQAINYFMKEHKAIFYVDFSKYEFERRENDKEDLRDICEIINSSDNRPLFIFDNVRIFECGMSEIFDEFAEQILDICSCYVILSEDFDYSNNFKENKLDGEFKKFSEFYKTEYENLIKITSLNLNRRKQAKEFIKNCKNFFNINLSEIKIKNAAKLIDKMINLKLTTIDAYQFDQIIQAIRKIENEEYNLNDIYEKWLSNDINLIAEQVYKYEYKKETNIDFNSNSRAWKNVRKHRSAMEFAIAKYYINCLNDKIGGKSVTLPNNLFTKNVNRFIVNKTMIDTNFIRHIQNEIDNDNIKNWSGGQLSQILYLVGRNNTCRSIDILNGLKEKFIDNQGYENELISTRISLIHKEDGCTNLNEYCRLIIENNKAAEENNAFHLECYGDTTNTQNNNYSLNDDTSKGINTLRALSLSIEDKINRYLKDKLSIQERNVLVLHLVTFSKIIESRNKDVYAPIEDVNYMSKFTSFFLGFDYKFYEREREDELTKYKIDDKIIEYLREVFIKTCPQKQGINIFLCTTIKDI